MMTTRTVSAADLHIGDLVLSPVGPPRRVTLHRLQGTPPVAVIGYADQAGQRAVPVSELFSSPCSPASLTRGKCAQGDAALSLVRGADRSATAPIIGGPLPVPTCAGRQPPSPADLRGTRPGDPGSL